MVAQRAGRDVRVRDAAELGTVVPAGVPLEATRLTLGWRFVALAELTLVLVLLPILACFSVLLVGVVLLVDIVCILAGYAPSFRRRDGSTRSRSLTGSEKGTRGGRVGRR